jgi:endonuclease/exonuclease/phosphatase family metal-dependent hydrolase
MTLNLAHARRGGPQHLFLRRGAAEVNLARIAEAIRREAPDLVALQEADGPSSWSGRFDHVEKLAELAGYGHLFRGEHTCFWRGRRRICYGSALLSRQPLSEAASQRFARSLPTPTKGFVAATLKAAGHGKPPVRVVSVHLDFSRRRVRLRQVLHLAEALAGSAEPLVVLGDFNCQWEGREDTLQLLAGLLGVRPYRPGRPELLTFPARRPRKRIDWILISRELDFRSYAVLPDRLSDHLPVVAEVVRAG